MAFAPLRLVSSAPLVTPPQPAPFSVGGTIVGAIKAYTAPGASSIKGGAAAAAVNVALGAVGTAIPAVGVALGVASALGLDLGSMLGTKSKANWNRTLGRVYRAALLGYVPAVAGAERIIGQIKTAWVSAGDSSGAQFWDRVVSVFGVPTEAGGTKEGFSSGAPAGSKTAEGTRGFSAGLTAFLSAVG